MDEGKIIFYWFVWFFAIPSIIVLIGCFLYNYINILANENAQRLCEERGYETYIYYTHIFYSTQPKGLICGTIKERMIYEGRIKQYLTNANSTIIVNGGVK